ncbi:MAG: hypothetical protein JWO69_1686 [Thermoleophilia bacterium]|nr:hypothetical protein [Thermoleophilia bacterium]
MSFLDYLKEHRGQYIDHRATPPSHAGVSIDDVDPGPYEPTGSSTRGGGPGEATRRRRPRAAHRSIRLRYVRPAFAPSAFSDPLPYEEPWERAFR